MSAVFLYKKIIVRIACGVCAFISFACMCFAYTLFTMKSVALDEEIYFLVSNDTRIEAGAEFVKWNGGAGYLMECNGAHCVAYTVFFSRSDGEKVQQNLKKSGELTTLVEKTVRKLYFRGKEKRRAGLYVSALKLLKSYMLLLEDCIGRVESGLTQETCKRLLKILEKQFNYSQVTHAGYPAFAKLCGESGAALYKIAADVVYLKDLRFLLCWQAEKYIELCSSFML